MLVPRIIVSGTDRECHARVVQILKLDRLKENKLFLSTKACRHLQLFVSGPILSVILQYCCAPRIDDPDKILPGSTFFYRSFFDLASSFIHNKENDIIENTYYLSLEH